MAVAGVDLWYRRLLSASLAMGVGGNLACHASTFCGTRVMEDLPSDCFRYQASQIQEADEDLCGNQKAHGALKVNISPQSTRRFTEYSSLS